MAEDMEYQTLFDAHMDQLPVEYHRLIDVEHARSLGAFPMRFYSFLDLPKEARDFVSKAIVEAERRREVNLICSNYSAGLCLLGWWPSQTPLRMNIHPKDETNRESDYRIYPDNRDKDVITSLSTPRVFWVRNGVFRVSDWWKYRNVTELRF